MKEKTCSKCKEKKPATSEYFYRKKQSPDGWEYKCKACFKKDVKNCKKKTTKKTRPETGNKEPKHILTIDFTGHVDTLNRLTDFAKKELRTPDNQLLYWLETRSLQDIHDVGI